MTTFDPVFGGSTADELELRGQASQPRGFWPVLAISFLWGLAVSFSMLPEELSAKYFMQGGSLLGALILLTVYYPKTIVAWAGTFVGWMVCVHGVVGSLSGLMASVPPAGCIRYLLLIPTISVFAAAVELGPNAVKAVRVGLTLSVVPFLAYHLREIDPAQLFKAGYRITMFMNTNGVAFVAGMSAVSLFEFALRRLAEKKFFTWTGLSCAVGTFLCIVLIIATKSRTATIATTVGLFTVAYLIVGFKRIFIIGTLVSIVSLAVAYSAVVGLAEATAEVFQLFGGMRDVSEGTGRFRAWGIIISEIWLPHFFFGIGPLSVDAIQETAGVQGAHNGFLVSLAETGFLGTFPIILVVILSARRAWRLRKHPQATIAIALFVTGVTEAMAETMFFSMGNIGSLLFTMSLAVLAGREAPPPQPTDAEAATPHPSLDEHTC